MGGPRSQDQSDPLAETAAAPIEETATSAGSARPPPAEGERPSMIGRYRITDVLGAGAMGIVYSAVDPDLERTIALKVLLGANSDAGRARLLREARAMAKLSHGAVVTVHEVGTAAGVDYVAMELIDGSTLAEWISRDQPSEEAILDAFAHAGRGLAAAHAKGLVHLDFKPQNVLRSKSGRVVVTDFGLARAAFEAHDVSPEAAQRISTRDAGSLSSTLTQTGAVLGTPAYMAPEQHDGSEVGPAADQFAYCVALWEALSGERPFKGQTLAQVRQHIDRGPDAESEAKLPRRLRPVLRRGLAVRPAARFSNMEALLAAMSKRSARVGVTLAALGVVGMVIGGVVVLGSSKRATVPPVVVPEGCGPAETELAAFTRSPARAGLADSAVQLAALDALAADWIATQRDVCARQHDPDHARRMTCLRATRHDLELALAAFAALPASARANADPVQIASDPKSCGAKTVPVRKLVDDPRALPIAVAGLRDKQQRDALEDPGADAPCLRAEYFMSKLHDFERLRHDRAVELVASASEAIDRCGDDRIAASLTMLELSSNFGKMTQELGGRRMPAVVARSGDDRMLAVIASMIEGLAASFRFEHDPAIAHMTTAVDNARALGMRGFAANLTMMLASWLQRRSGPGDLEAAERRVREALTFAPPQAQTRLRHELIEILQYVGRGDEAIAEAAKLNDDAPARPGSIAVTGRVLDEAGQPVAGARVVAQERIVVFPDQLDPTSAAVATAITGTDGTFTIAGAPPDALVMAALGTRRTLPVKRAERVELRMVPTGTVTGTVKRVGDRLGMIAVAVVLPPPFARVEYTAPIAADGTWRIDHVPRGKAKVVATFGYEPREIRIREVQVGAQPAGPITFELANSGVPVHVVLRNQVAAPISLGLAFMIRGKFAATTVADLDRVTQPMQRARAFMQPREDAHPSVQPLVKPGDVTATFPSLAPGELTLCALGISGELSDQTYMTKLEKHAPTFAVACTPVTITRADQAFVLEVPPMKRLPDD